MTMARSQVSDRPFKILLIGDSSVGKTCLMFRFADGKFNEHFIPTIGIDFKTKDLTVRNQKIKLQLWDTAGQEKFFNITRSYYRNADAILLVYDRTEASSFQHVSLWMRCIEENAPEDVVRILVGNKSDLHHRLVISTTEGRRLADKYHVDFFETSAKSETNSNVADMFDFLAEKLLDIRQPRSQQPTIKIDKSKDPSNSIYGNVMSCCGSTTTAEK